MKGYKQDEHKDRWDLVQPRALQEYVRVLTHGAGKYGAGNWQFVADAKDRYFAATLRHLWAWLLGQRHDPDSGLHPLAHAMCSIAFVLEKELSSSDQDSLDGWAQDLSSDVSDWSQAMHAGAKSSCHIGDTERPPSMEPEP